MAKKFFYVCMGILALAGAFALGSNSVSAQVGGEFVGISIDGVYNNTAAITADGSIYARSGKPVCQNEEMVWNNPCAQWTLMGNVFDQPVSSEAGSLGDVKSMYR